MLLFILLWMHACFCCVTFSFSVAKRLAGTNVSEMPYFVFDGT